MVNCYENSELPTKPAPSLPEVPVRFAVLIFLFAMPADATERTPGQASLWITSRCKQLPNKNCWCPTKMAPKKRSAAPCSPQKKDPKTRKRKRTLDPSGKVDNGNTAIVGNSPISPPNAFPPAQVAPRLPLPAPGVGCHKRLRFIPDPYRTIA